MREFASLRGDGWLPRRGAELCLALSLSPLFAWLRPTAFDEQTLFPRFACWALLLACWFMAMAAVEALLAERRFFQNLSVPVQRALQIMLAAVPMVVIGSALNNALTGWQVTVAGVVNLYWKTLILGPIATLLAEAVLPWIADVVRVQAQHPQRVPVALPVAPAPPPALSRLALRLPPEVRGRILCLEMEDHYVRVHTDRGSALVLMRLGDAISAAHPVPGRQVHRSWWVSDEAVAGFERTGRTGLMRLVNGARVPVSQRYLRVVEETFARGARA